MILTTPNSIEAYKIVAYLGIVIGVSTNCNLCLKENIEKAKEEPFQQLKTNAIKLKANTIIGIKVDMEFLEQRYKTIVSVVGTAVLVK